MAVSVNTYKDLIVKLEHINLKRPNDLAVANRVAKEICINRSTKIIAAIHALKNNEIIYKMFPYDSICGSTGFSSTPYIINLLIRGVTYDEKADVELAIPLLYFKLDERTASVNYNVIVYYPKQIIDSLLRIIKYESINKFTLGFVLYCQGDNINEELISFLNNLSVNVLGRGLEQIEYHKDEAYVAFPHTTFIEGIIKYSAIATVVHLLCINNFFGYELHLAYTDLNKHTSKIIDVILQTFNYLLNIVNHNILHNTAYDKIRYIDYYGLTPKRLVYSSRKASLANALEVITKLIHMFIQIDKIKSQ